MEMYAVPKAWLTNIADKIRSKLGITDSIEIPDMPAEIDKISGGGTFSINVHDPSTDKDGIYIDKSGKEITYSGWSATEYMDIPNGATYVIWDYYENYNVFFDENKNAIKSFGPGGGSVPSNAKFVRFSAPKSSMSKAIISFYNTI